MGFFEKLFGKKQVVTYVEPLQIEKYEKFKVQFENIIQASDLGADVTNMYLYVIFRLPDYQKKLDAIHYTDEDLKSMFGQDSSGKQAITRESYINDFCLTPKVNKISQHKIITSKRNFEYFKDREVWAEMLLDNLENYYNFMQKFTVNTKEIDDNLNSPSYFLGLTDNVDETYKKLRDFLTKFMDKGLEATIKLSALYSSQVFIYKNLVLSSSYCLDNKYTQNLFESIKDNVTLFRRGYNSYVPYYDETNFVYELVMDFIKSKDASLSKQYLIPDCIRNTEYTEHRISIPADFEMELDFYEYYEPGFDNCKFYSLNNLRGYEFEFLTLNTFLRSLNIQEHVTARDLRYILMYETFDEFLNYLDNK